MGIVNLARNEEMIDMEEDPEIPDVDDERFHIEPPLWHTDFIRYST